MPSCVTRRSAVTALAVALVAGCSAGETSPPVAAPPSIGSPTASAAPPATPRSPTPSGTTGTTGTPSTAPTAPGTSTGPAATPPPVPRGQVDLSGRSDSKAARVGSWSRVLKWPVIAANAALLPNGKVISWGEGESAYDKRRGEILGFAKAAVWNPATKNFTDVTNRTTNVFAGGQAFLADGRLLVTGGQSIRDIPHPRGLPHTNIFDYRDNSWTRVKDMKEGRWYPTTIALANGETLTVGGNDDSGVTNEDIQVWKTTGGWRYIAKRKMSLYPGMLLAPSGEAFYAGPRPQTLFLDTATGRFRKGPYNDFQRQDNIKTVPTVMYDGTVLTVGGGNVGEIGIFKAAADAEVVDLNDKDPQWRRVAPMANPRRHHNATPLPDKTILVTGGQREGYNGSPITEIGVRVAEVYDPAADSWTTLSAMKVPRGYHSTAVLLPDGRVLVAGTGNGAAENQYNAQIFSPPYLFRGARPEIASVPATVAYGEQFPVATPDAADVEDVRLIRLGATTHSFDMNTRLVTLDFSRGESEVTVTSPAEGTIAPPGQYMLFLLDSKGVPSIARIISVGNETVK